MKRANKHKQTDKELKKQQQTTLKKVKKVNITC